MKSGLTEIFEGVDRVFVGSFNGRIETEDSTDCKGDQKSDDENLPADKRGKRSENGK